jgi:hypothetical protein
MPLSIDTTCPSRRRRAGERAPSHFVPFVGGMQAGLPRSGPPRPLRPRLPKAEAFGKARMVHAPGMPDRTGCGGRWLTFAAASAATDPGLPPPAEGQSWRVIEIPITGAARPAPPTGAIRRDCLSQPRLSIVQLLAGSLRHPPSDTGVTRVPSPFTASLRKRRANKFGHQMEEDPV